ncbi:hypothetical protein [Mucilaginibacter rubeus]|uniref:Uncharacterized protein n=1 Tax=Mucilaginibacter rubeus TaxID=2027860 RepID=A0A5C1I5T9_9SPHI|nr:hypothetical protein [Mucilaginibacter rubeus]QEM13467.1 hypothetical protein DEO27_026805 [Mucilaginibacter rubeus]
MATTLTQSQVNMELLVSLHRIQATVQVLTEAVADLYANANDKDKQEVYTNMQKAINEKAAALGNQLSNLPQL